MKEWKPRLFKKWPPELQAIYNLSDKKWEKAIKRIFIEAELAGKKNIKSGKAKWDSITHEIVCKEKCILDQPNKITQKGVDKSEKSADN